MVNYEIGQFAADPAKAASRQFILEEALRTFSGIPGNTTAYHLCGDNLEEAKILQAAGFRPKNIVGVELSEEAYREAHRLNQEQPRVDRFDIRHSELGAELARDYNIGLVSIDGVAQYSSSYVSVLDDLFTNAGFRSNGHLIVNMQAQREHPKNQLRLLQLTVNAPQAMIGAYYPTVVGEETSQYIEYDGKGNDLVIDPSKKSGMGQLMQVARHSIVYDVALRAQNPFLLTLSDEEVMDLAEGATKRFGIPEEALLEFREGWEKVAGYRVNGNRMDSMDLTVLINWQRGAIIAEGLERFADELDPSLDHAARLRIAGAVYVSQADRLKSVETFEYTSSSGTNMMMHSFGFAPAIDASNFESTEFLIEYQQLQERLLASSDRKYASFRKGLEHIGLTPWISNIMKAPPKMLSRFRAGMETLSFVATKGGYERAALAGNINELVMAMEISGAVADTIRSIHPIIQLTSTKAKRLADKMKLEIADIIEEEPEMEPEPIVETTYTAANTGPNTGDLTWDDKEAMRDLRGEGHTCEEIHNAFGEPAGLSRRQTAAILAHYTIRKKKAEKVA